MPILDYEVGMSCTQHPVAVHVAWFRRGFAANVPDWGTLAPSALLTRARRPVLPPRGVDERKVTSGCVRTYTAELGA